MPQQQSDMHPLSAILNVVEVDAGVLAYVNALGDKGRAQLVDVASAKERLTPTERSRAIFLLGQLRWRPAFDSLRKLLHDESAKVRLSTLYALSKIDGPLAVPLLLETIKDPKSGDFRTRACLALPFGHRRRRNDQSVGDLGRRRKI